MKRYEGYRDIEGCQVWVQSGLEKPRKLRLRLDLSRHSPTGFEWGYGGSGPAQLALALLADALNDKEAIQLHQRFKRFIAEIKTDVWTMTEEDIKEKVLLLGKEPLLTPKQERESLR